MNGLFFLAGKVVRGLLLEGLLLERILLLEKAVTKLGTAPPVNRTAKETCPLQGRCAKSKQTRQSGVSGKAGCLCSDCSFTDVNMCLRGASLCVVFVLYDTIHYLLLSIGIFVNQPEH